MSLKGGNSVILSSVLTLALAFPTSHIPDKGADKPPPPQVASQEFLMAAETSTEYFS